MPEAWNLYVKRARLHYVHPPVRKILRQRMGLAAGGDDRCCCGEGCRWGGLSNRGSHPVCFRRHPWETTSGAKIGHGEQQRQGASFPVGKNRL